MSASTCLQSFLRSCEKHYIDAGMSGDPDAMSDAIDYFNTAKVSKVILFNAEQVEVFLKLIEDKDLPISMEYRLPFMDVWLQFSRPIEILLADGTHVISAFLLSQMETDKDTYERGIKYLAERDKQLGSSPKHIKYEWPDADTAIFNKVSAVSVDNGVCETMTWVSEESNKLHVSGAEDPASMKLSEKVRRLAGACIQYINCENVYLEKVGEIPEVVNRKREKKGKSRLEPYYVCRIRGVQYDSDGTGEGSKHGIRYDVRGHFRRMDTGKTIWVRPHQRGLKNELYIPKVYHVSKGAKDLQAA